LVNEDPFGEGWLIKATIENTSQLDGLMNAADYDAFTAAS
jgi:glycine cleavage system H protein